MSLFKSRSGGSLFRARAISGYIKVLFEKVKNDDNLPSEPRVQNSMFGTFNIKKDE